jgi:transcriptional regulator with XRE-family HTH domain
MAIVDKSATLNGRELRFLRQMMCLSQVDLAQRLGTTEQTLARWEKRQVPFPATADKLLRVFYLAFANKDAAAQGLIVALNFVDRVKNFRLEFTESEGHWIRESAEVGE